MSPAVRLAAFALVAASACGRPPGYTIPVCDAPHQNCRCELAGFQICDGVCVNPQYDHDHCGGCGQGCGDGFCVAGQCASSCGGLPVCGSACEYTDDPANCGGCGIACDGACISGTCGPRPAGCAKIGRTFCDGACVELQTDPANCGACGVACPTGHACAAGVCQ